jgi:SAM-dependent methyltransferase
MSMRPTLVPESVVSRASPKRDGVDASAPRAPEVSASDYLELNKAAWERWAPAYEKKAGREAWDSEDVHWGLWGAPESNLRLLRELGPKADVVELGCGTAATCAALARRGFRPVGVDFVRPLLETAAGLQREFGLSFALLCANVEQLHFDDATFDCAISEYGASIWCHPERWLPEAHRILRPGGLLVFITNSPLLMTCTPDDGGPVGEQLVREYFADERVEFPGDPAVEFHLTHGEWMRQLRLTGFVAERLIETRPPDGAQPRFDVVSAEWAQRWPSEDIWVARKAS